MIDNTVALVLAGYPAVDTARLHFQAAAVLVRSRELSARGLILVARNLDGAVNLVETCDDHGHTGRGWRAGVGVLVGLFDPVMLGTVVVGSLGGSVVDAFSGHRLRRALQEQIGAHLGAGAAAVLAVVPSSERPVLEATLAGANAVSAVESDLATLTELEAALQESMTGLAP